MKSPVYDAMLDSLDRREGGYRGGPNLALLDHVFFVVREWQEPLKQKILELEAEIERLREEVDRD